MINLSTVNATENTQSEASPSDRLQGALQTYQNQVARHQDDIRELLSPHRTDVSPALLAGFLESLVHHLEAYFRLEEELALFNEATLMAPRLHEQTKALWDEHLILFAELCEIADLAKRSTGPKKPAGESALQSIRGKFDTFCRHLATHHELECELTLEAFYVDIGGG